MPLAAAQETELNRLLQQLVRPDGEKQFQKDSIAHILEKEPEEAVKYLVFFLSRTLSEYVKPDIAAWWISTVQELKTGLIALKEYLEEFGKKSEKKVAVLTALCHVLAGFEASAFAMARYIDRESKSGFVAFPLETLDSPWLGLTGLPIKPKSWLPDEEN